MSDNAPESEKKVSDQVAQHFFDYVGRHLVCLAMQVITIKDGKPEDEEEFWAFSGFVMSFKGMWFFITAGHILKAVDDRLKDKTLAITGCRFADYFGMGTTVPLPTPFDYESAVKGYIDDDSVGLDIGMIYLSPLYREGFKKNGIIAIWDQDWVHQHKVEFTKYYMLGFPTGDREERNPESSPRPKHHRKRPPRLAPCPQDYRSH